MANQHWLDEVRTQLAHQALPPTYIKRFMEELSDHFQDLTEDTMSTEANVSFRLGEPNQVAKAAVAAYRRRSLDLDFFVEQGTQVGRGEVSEVENFHVCQWLRPAKYSGGHMRVVQGR